MHPRSRHSGRYDLRALAESLPALAPFVAKNRYGDESIDFADPAAVLALNRALLKHHYGIGTWSLPAGALCPPIPGRADYIHHLADLPGVGRGDAVRVLDVGVGANCIYPIIGRAEYGWSFVGSDIDQGALDAAGAIVRANPVLAGGVELRLQPTAESVFRGVVRDGERFDLTLCNPPFHASREEAREAAARKLTGLAPKGVPPRAGADPVRNFGGTDAELWCPGGEAGFVRRMIRESAGFAERAAWFTTLLSKSANLPDVDRELTRAGVADRRTIELAHGNKVSRIIAWTFSSRP